MTNEANLVYQESASAPVIQDYNISGGQAMEKGQLAALGDDRTVSGSAVQGEPMAGIVARETLSGDGRTRIAVYKKGYFEVLASGSIPVGAPIRSDGNANQVSHAVAGASGSRLMGYAEETAGDAETFVMRLDL